MPVGLNKTWLLTRGRWRWIRGRCPACNRELRAHVRPSAGAAACAICADETQMDLRVWHNYRRSVARSPLPLR